MFALFEVVIGAVMSNLLWTRVSDTTTVVFDDQTLGCLSSQLSVFNLFYSLLYTRSVFISCCNGWMRFGVMMNNCVLD